MTIEQIKSSVNLDRFIGQYIELKQQGPHFVGLCPFHEEKTPSLTVTPGKAIWKCFGCSAGGDVFEFCQQIEQCGFLEAARKIAEFLGVELDEHKPAPKTHSAKVAPIPHNQDAKPRPVAYYEYTNAAGEPLYEVVRFEPGQNGRSKDFKVRRRHADGGWVWGLSAGSYRKRSDGDWRNIGRDDGPVAGDETLEAVERVLWRLPQAIGSYEVILCEGEKDVLTLEALGYVATTISGGSQQSWLDTYTEALTGKRVILLPDRDAPGEKLASKIHAALVGKAAELFMVLLPSPYKDVTEYVDAGHTLTDLEKLIHAVERESRETEYRIRGLLAPYEILSRSPGGVEAFLDARKRPKGLLTGFTKLDEMTMGLQAGELIILAARPTMGKTALLLNIAGYMCRRQKKVIAIFSLEMSGQSLLQRMVCSEARIDSLRFRSGYCSGEERYQAQTKYMEIAEHALRIDDTPYLDMAELDRKLELLAKDSEIAMVGIDYLQLMSAGKSVKSGANRVAEISEITRGLKLTARKFDCPMIVLSQLSRACESRPGDHRPMLADLRDSGSIEQDADVVAFIYRREVYEPHREELRGNAELIIGKQRNGPIGTAHLVFLNHYTRFENSVTYEQADLGGAA